MCGIATYFMVLKVVFGWFNIHQVCLLVGFSVGSYLGVSRVFKDCLASKGSCLGILWYPPLQEEPWMSVVCVGGCCVCVGVVCVWVLCMCVWVLSVYVGVVCVCV